MADIGYDSRHDTDAGAQGQDRARFDANWGLMLAMGIALGLGGVLAVLMPVAASIAAEAFIGAALLIGGVLQAVHAWRAVGWRGRALHGVSGLIYVVGAGLIAFDPFAGLVALTLVTIAVIGADGIVRIVAGFQNREDAGWGWLVLSGALSVVFAGVLMALFPAVSTVLLGVMLGVSLVIEGSSFVAWSLVLRKRARGEAG